MKQIILLGILVSFFCMGNAQEVVNKQNEIIQIPAFHPNMSRPEILK